MKKTDLRIKFEDNLKTIIDLYWNKNMSSKEIADRLGFKYSTLQQYMSSYHLLKPVGQSNLRYTVDESFFEVIDTEKKAYWLGVLYADGCVMHIKNTKYVVFSTTDKEWIEQYKQDLSFTGPILSEKHTKFNRLIYKVKITSKKLYADLVEKGVVERKSLFISFPFSHLSAELIPHFIRGYFDGDGSVGVYENKKGKSWKRLHASFTCGSKQFLESLRSWLLEHNVIPISQIRKRNNRNVYLLDLSLISGLRLREIMYKNATIYLERKRKKFYSVDYPKRTFNDYNRVSLIKDKGIVCSHTKV